MKNTNLLQYSLIASIILVLISHFVAPTSANWKVSDQGVLFNEGQVLGDHDTRQAGPPPGVPGAANRSNQPTNTAQTDNDSGQDRTPPGLLRQADRAPRTTGRSIQLQPRNDRILIQSEPEDDLSTDVVDESIDQETEVLEIEEHASKRNVRVRSKDNAAVVIRDRIAAQTRFPLMVNLDTNELIVTTPAGQRAVTVLPDAAVRNMLAARVLDQIGGKGGLRWLDSITPDPDATDSADLADPDEATDSADIDDPTEATESAEISEPEQEQEVSIEEVDTVVELVADEEGNLVYEIEGTRSKRLLGIFPVELNRTAVVSADTGALLELRQDWRTRILDLLSR